jgi:hypothetical protein
MEEIPQEKRQPCTLYKIAAKGSGNQDVLIHDSNKLEDLENIRENTGNHGQRLTRTKGKTSYTSKFDYSKEDEQPELTWSPGQVKWIKDKCHLTLRKSDKRLNTQGAASIEETMFDIPAATAFEKAERVGGHNVVKRCYAFDVPGVGDKMKSDYWIEMHKDNPNSWFFRAKRNNLIVDKDEKIETVGDQPYIEKTGFSPAQLMIFDATEWKPPLQGIQQSNGVITVCANRKY